MTMIYMIDGIPQYLTVSIRKMMINHQGVGHMKGRKSVKLNNSGVRVVLEENVVRFRFSSWQKLLVLPMEIRLNCEMKMGRYVMITFMKI